MSTTEQPPAPPPPPPPPSDGPRVSGNDVRNLGRLRRTVHGSPYGRHIGGVAGGIARHLDIDPVVVRVVLVILGIFGPGLLIYLGLWLVVPTEDEEPALIRLDDNTRLYVLWIGVGLAASAMLASMIEPWQHRSVFWLFGPWSWLWVWVVIAGVLWYQRRRRAESGWVAPEPAGPGVSGDSAATTPGVTVDPAAATVTITRPQRPVRPPKPPRTGPVLFWPVVALIALAEGVLGVADLAGLHTVPAAYPALAVAIIAVALIVGAFWGRAGGLIAIGFLGVLATLGATAAHQVHWGPGTVDTPRTAAAVADAYDEMGIGHYTLDLTRVGDPGRLDGRTVYVSGRVGNLEIDVPSAWGVDFDGTVSGAGQIETSDSGDTGRGGSHVTWSHHYPPAGKREPTITIDAHLGFGLIDLRRVP